VALSITLAALVRATLLESQGYRYDLDTFVQWAHQVTIGPLSAAYRGDLNLPPVMVYVWASLGAMQPLLASAVDASDAVIRAVMKLPANAADLILAGLVAWSLRANPGWAVAGALLVGLHPALLYDSAWWGQVDSLYVLPAFIAFLFAIAGRWTPAAIALAVCVMTKPQALPLLVPFAAYALGQRDRKALIRSIAVFTGTTILIWAPFLQSGGLADYVRNVLRLQTELLAVTTVSAWNAWWLSAPLLSSGLGSDLAPLLGPISPRVIGYLLAAVLLAAVFIVISRHPSPRRLALGLAATTLICFSLMTSMHERYAIAAIVFLAPLLPDRRVLMLWITVSVAITANMVVMVPPWRLNLEPWDVWLLSVLGGVLMLGSTAVALWLLQRDDEIVAPQDRSPVIQVATGTPQQAS
jgi:Gpi18-like mannosyltransferase